MRNQEAATVARLLVDKVLCVHGCPLQILTDQGPNFESALFQELCKLMAIDKIRTSPYRPSTNGNIERFHGTMHSMLVKLVSENHRDWDQLLPAIAFAYRTSVQESTKFTPYYLLHGREARIPADLIYGPPPEPEQTPDLPQFVEEQQRTLRDAFSLVRQHLGHAARRRKRDYDLRARPRHFATGSWVWVYTPRRKMGRYPKWQSLYQGPFLVIKQLGPVNYLVQRSPKSNPWTVHVDKLTPCHQSGQEGWIAPAADTDPGCEKSPAPESSPELPATAVRPRRETRIPARYR